MKNFFLVLGMLCLSLSGYTQQTSPTPSVSVTGSAKKTLQPDFIRIQININNEGTTAKDAQEATTKASADAISYLKSKSGIKNIETNYVHLRANHQYDQKHPRQYVATQSISFELHQMGEYNTVIIDLLNKGVNGIGFIIFDSTEREKHERNLLAKAIADAREQATFMASELGQEIGKAIHISDGSHGGPSPLPMYRSMDMTESASIAPKELEITKQVQITFELK